MRNLRKRSAKKIINLKRNKIMPIYDKDDIIGYIYKGNQFFCIDCFDTDKEDPEDFKILVEKEMEAGKIYICEKCEKQIS